jgi:hypothetical protein
VGGKNGSNAMERDGSARDCTHVKSPEYSAQ